MEIVHPIGKNRHLFDPFMESCVLLEEVSDVSLEDSERKIERKNKEGKKEWKKQIKKER